jgi:hypothetical protein
MIKIALVLLLYGVFAGLASGQKEASEQTPASVPLNKSTTLGS